jgi:PHD/YefM family antitoxin component YafN of YafNO toxin-antitoxin module
MKVATQNEVAADFVAYVKASKKGPVVVTRDGKPVAVLFSSESDEDVERLLMGHSPKLQSILQAARERFRRGGGIPHEDFWKDVETEKTDKTPKRSRPAKNRGTNGRS